MADFLARHSSECPLGIGLWSDSLRRQGDGRIRSGLGVSGHIRGMTNTIPLHVEILYNEYNFVAAFAMASLLACLALGTLVIKTLVEWRMRALGESRQDAINV
jgi:NO-binding membrane sensor protein with MHYT domain